MTSSDLLDKAKLAISTGDEGQSEKLYEEIVKEIEGQVGKNQKDIATELQKISRSLEAQGEIDHAFLFKQRTCATMLRLSMEERRGSRTLAATRPPAGSPQSGSLPSSATHDSHPPAVRPSTGTSTGTGTIIGATTGNIGRLEFICMPTDDPERSMALYRKAIDAQTSSNSSGPQNHSLINLGGTSVLFVERSAPCGPVFRVQAAESTAGRLAESGFTRHPIRVSTPHGLVVFLIDFSGNAFGLLEG